MTLDNVIKGLGWDRLQIVDEDGNNYRGSRTVEVEVFDQMSHFVIVETEDGERLELQRLVRR